MKGKEQINRDRERERGITRVQGSGSKTFSHYFVLFVVQILFCEELWLSCSPLSLGGVDGEVKRFTEWFLNNLTGSSFSKWRCTAFPCFALL